MASAQMEGLKAVMQQMMAQGLAAKFDGDIDPQRLRSVIQVAQANMSTEPGVSFVPCELNGVEAEFSVPRNARQDAIIIYVHGGGLICGNARTSRGYASVLAGETNIPVYSFSYRLAPENKFPAAVEDSYAVYKAVLEKHPILCGMRASL